MINHKIDEVPVLLLIFNRPDTVGKVMDALRGIKPKYLYIAADGPRTTGPEERAKTDAARKIATVIDWPCEVKTLFREDNLGCRQAVSGAIDWFFENVEEGIILEDDCVPDPSYFRFASELLLRYRDDERVMSIGAVHFPGAAHQPPYGYFFSRNQHCWGWASWRRAWRLYDREMSNWPTLRESDWLLGLGDGNRMFQRYWTDIFDRAHAGKIDSWAYRWTFSCWEQNGLSILPVKNLVKNIGFESDATHTAGGNKWELDLERMAFPLVHPAHMVRDNKADAWSDRHVFLIHHWSVLRLAGKGVLCALRKFTRKIFSNA